MTILTGQVFPKEKLLSTILIMMFIHLNLTTSLEKSVSKFYFPIKKIYRVKKLNEKLNSGQILIAT